MEPGQHGITMVIDTGLPTGAFTDLIESHGQLIDLVKFGWGTAMVTKDLDRKTGVLNDAGVGFYFGGTLFEHSVWTGRLADYLTLVERTGATHIEVSNGTIPLDQEGKAGYVRRLAGIRPILSEVGYKDADRSALLTPADWVDALAEDLDAGACMVITEARESGRSGIAGADGHMRPEVLSAVLEAIDPALVMFETPTKDLQVEMIRAVGPEVNMGNVAASDVVGVETLRRGLRGDTLLDLTTGVAGSPRRSRRPAQPARPTGRTRPRGSVRAAGPTPSAA